MPETMGSAPRLLFNVTAECNHSGQSWPWLMSGLPFVRARTSSLTSRCLSRRTLGSFAVSHKEIRDGTE